MLKPFRSGPMPGLTLQYPVYDRGLRTRLHREYQKVWKIVPLGQNVIGRERVTARLRESEGEGGL